jgi:hypothetical protein
VIRQSNQKKQLEKAKHEAFIQAARRSKAQQDKALKRSSRASIQVATLDGRCGLIGMFHRYFSR